MKADVYKTIIDALKEAISSDELNPWVIPWEKVYSGSGPLNFISENSYRGINNILLSLVYFKKEYPFNVWLTFNQIRDKKLKLKKGSKGVPILYYSKAKKKNEKSIEEEEFYFVKRSTVFNVSQLDQIPSEIMENVNNYLEKKNIEPNKLLTKYFTAHNVVFDQDLSNEAYYCPKNDRIKIPNYSQFKNESAFFSTLFHEVIHSTGHKKRLKRFEETYNHERYSKEEIIAETGAIILQKLNGTFSESEFNQSASYIKGYQKNVSEKTLVQSFSKAMQAVDFVLNS